MENVTNINFKAKPLNNIYVQKLNRKDKVFVPIRTTFVQLENDNPLDMEVIENAAIAWKDASYMNRIVTNSHWADYIPVNFYALTTQMKNFHKLDYKKILGFAEMRKDLISKNFDSLYYLQVKPEAINLLNSSKSTYKKVGSSILTSLKKIYTNISLFSEDSPILFDFYKKNKFVRDYNFKTRFLWSSNPFMKLKIYYDSWCKQSYYL